MALSSGGWSSTLNEGGRPLLLPIPYFRYRAACPEGRAAVEGGEEKAGGGGSVVPRETGAHQHTEPVLDVETPGSAEHS